MFKRNFSDIKIYVFDINILLYEFYVFFFFKEYDVVIFMIVLEEFDYIKDSKKDVVCDVRVLICVMEDLLYDVILEEMLVGVMMEGMGVGFIVFLGSFFIFIDLNMVEI